MRDGKDLLTKLVAGFTKNSGGEGVIRLNSCESSYTATGQDWHILSFNRMPEACA